MYDAIYERLGTTRLSWQCRLIETDGDILSAAVSDDSSSLTHPEHRITILWS